MSLAFADPLQVDNLLPYPNERLRERVFSDGTRLDVLLMDKDGKPVVVECKQGAPSAGDVRQLRGYMKHIRKVVRQKPRGILIHGGARKRRKEVRRVASERPRIEIVQHRLEVGFSISQ